ncbi:hypothetical protein Dshi_2640 [Dinoroseobacter shibae DFL 12 = DSM 16493]|uniref:Uncharacterized protein n=1 Tax=Dinoroseobacter shibae (strain DSM 16493 / NCIMB 14021 / DFL 12) TaxID=398580 RepID=A8LI39_DINSH|nr:hypothetical protein [Dinoroseobacter shibae]ABV94373.1 hypothetical protein Dshi_2640 [Dinoroseobacter shibae DFL 12 = DSM 16493]URF45803.1 hypothetical protein M8008_13605 [Dinoroseobacter shibae]URF50109.1 hypothetical protein M8007_13605 [Dinoroseobacter shibae]
MPSFSLRLLPVCGPALALALTAAVALPDAASANECARQLNFLGSNASDTRKINALLTCAEETRSDLAALETRVAELERKLGRTERQVEGLADLGMRVSGLERSVTQQGRSLEGLDDRISRAVTAATRDLQASVNADIRALRTEIRGAAAGDGDVTRLTRRIDQLAGRKWEEFGAAQRPVGRSQTNSREYPIVVAATINVGDSNRCHARLKVNGVTVAETRNNNDSWDKACFVTTTVPPGASYVLESAPHGGGRPRVSKWAELR